MSDEGKDLNGITEVEGVVRCSRGLVGLCQGYAIAERDDRLFPGSREEWLRISGECGTTSCCFNKIGRDERSAQAKEAVTEFAHNREVDELRTHSHAWTDSMTG